MPSISLIISDILITLSRIAVASVIAWLAAIVTGILLSKYRSLYRLILPVLNFFRQISPFAWLPFAIIIFGLGELPIQFVLFTAMFFPSVLMVYEILQLFPKAVLEEARCAGAHGFTLIREIEIPMIMAQLIDVYRMLWAVGWSTVIAAEMLGVSRGLGFRLLDYRYLLAFPPMLLYIVVIGSIGIVSDMGINKIRNQFTLR
jgi:NitT/TauT family transport system permease protein